METYRVKLTITEDMLGTVPKSKEIYRDFVQAKAIEEAKRRGIELTEQQLQQEIDSVVESELEDKGWTGFHQVDGQPVLYDYCLRGFFKEATSSLRLIKGSQAEKVTAFKKKIDGLVFVFPRQIPIILPEGAEIGVLERPLRAETAKGPRVALARSDSVPPGTTLEFEVRMLAPLAPKGNNKKLLREWLEYGALKGLGQWRSGSWGRFEYELTKE